MKINISVILPEKYRGGTLRGALNIVRMLVLGARREGDDLDISFGHIDAPEVYHERDFRDLRGLGVRVRPFRLEVIPAKSLDILYDSWLDIPVGSRSEEYVVFNDGMSNFEETDFWLIVSDRLKACVPPHRPYALVVYDYIQRYVPTIFGVDQNTEWIWLLFEKYAEIARKAQFVICTTLQTQRDCVSYIGVREESVFHFPMEFDPVGELGGNRCAPDCEGDVPYIIWTTNSTQHKNHIRIIEGLEKFFSENQDVNLMIKMTGAFTHLFDAANGSGPHFNDPYMVAVRDAINATKFVKDRLEILGNVSDDKYVTELAGASWLLHGALYDNGTYSIIEAAWFGVPAVSSDYPAIRECCENFEIRVALFDAFQPESLSAMLKSCLPSREAWVNELPSREKLLSKSYSRLAVEYWRQFKNAYATTVAQ